MKLHLPVKLRASLIAAIFAVSASVYNAGAIDYVAPSNTFGWTTNDMTLAERYLATSGNTYTAVSTEYYVFKTYADNANVRVGYVTLEDGAIQELSYDGAFYHYTNGEGTRVNATPEGYYVLGTVDGATGESYIPVIVTGDGSVANPIEVTATNEGDTPAPRNDEASIIIRANASTSGSMVSVMPGASQFTTNGALQIDNSVQSGEGYTGKLDIDANKIVINPDSQGAGSIVVLEDVSITDYDGNGDTTPISTEIGKNSKLVIVNGNVEAVSDKAKQWMNLEDTRSTEGLAYRENSINLGAVSGTGSLTIVGGKDEEGKGNLTADIASITGESAANRFGEVNIANADVAVEGDITNATTVSLSNSAATVGGQVTTAGLNVDSEAGLQAGGNISNLQGQGSGHVNISGNVTSTDGSILLANGKAAEDLGIKEGAGLSAGQDILLSNIDAVNPGEITAGGNLTLTANSTLQNAGMNEETDGDGDVVASTPRVQVGGDLAVASGSSITNSSLNVKGDILVTDQLPGSSAAVAPSQLSGTSITVAPKDGETSTVTIGNGSTATDTTIIGANGDIIVGGESGDAAVALQSVNGTQNFISSTSEGEDGAQVTDKKGNLANILAAAEENALLTKEAIDQTGANVTSMIGNTTGNITIAKADVTGTVLTGGGNVAVGEPAQAGSADNQALLDTIRTNMAGTEPYDPATADDKLGFGTYVDGSIIDVRGNLAVEPQPENGLAVSASAVTNTIILGITGNIKVDGSLLANDYIDGGKGIEVTNNSIIVDTDIVNVDADIQIAGEATISSTDAEKPFVLTTKGTSTEYDKDDYTGGSILLEGTTLQNGIIKSGVTASLGEDGAYTYAPASSETNASHRVDGELSAQLPYGEISIKDSTLESMEVATAAGNIKLQGQANMVDKTLDPGLESPSSDKASGLTGFKTSLEKLGGNRVISVLNSISVQERPAGSSQATVPVKLQIKDGDVLVATSTNTQNFALNKEYRTFTFDSVPLDPEKVYTFAFVNESGESLEVGLSVIGNNQTAAPIYNGSAQSYSAIVKAEIGAAENLDAATIEELVKYGSSNNIKGSTISTGNGKLAADYTYMTRAESGAKTKITATQGGSTLANSYAEGTDIAINDAPGDAANPKASLSVLNSMLRGDVNLAAGDMILVSDAADIALDGYAANKMDEEGNKIKDASIAASVLRLDVLKDDAASIKNGELHMAVSTLLEDNNGRSDTLTMENTHGELGSLMGVTESTSTEFGNATVNIKAGSDLAAGVISTDFRDDPAWNTEAGGAGAKNSYFGNVNVEGDSQLTANGTVLIKNYRENVDMGNEKHPGKFKGTDVNGSTVTFKQDAHLTDAHLVGVDHKPTQKFGKESVDAEGVKYGVTSTTINGNAHIGNLRLDKDAVLNLVNTGEGDASSYIANIKPGFDDEWSIGYEKGATHGNINVVNGTLTTPDLDKKDRGGVSYLSLGLNGGIVVLDTVSAENGATVASEGEANAHVHVREITNAATAGDLAKDKTPVGESTIKETVDRVVSVYSETEGTPTTATARSYYYVVTNSAGYTVPEGQLVSVLNADGSLEEKSAGDTVAEGTIVVKTDKAVTTAEKVDGSVVNIGVQDYEAVNLTQEEAGSLSRITVPVLDENGGYIYQEVEEGAVLVVGQQITETELAYQEGWAENLGETATMVDGIASLTVDQDFDADKTIINAYQLGVKDENDKVSAVPNTGFITIKGDLTGQDNVLTADKDVTIKGIIADTQVEGMTTSAATETRNNVTSLAGNVAIGADGIVGSNNTVKAETGSVTVQGSLKGTGNTLVGALSATVQGGLLTDSRTVIGLDDQETTIKVTADSNTVTSKGNVTIGATAGESIQGDGNSITSTEAGNVLVQGTTRGNNNTISATLGNVSTGNIVGGDEEGTGNTVVSEGGNVTVANIGGNWNKVEAKLAEGVEDSGNANVTGDVLGDNNSILAENTATVGSIKGNTNSVTAQKGVTITHGILPVSSGTTTLPSVGNVILSHTGNVSIGATGGTSIAGDSNQVTAEAGNVTATGSIEGNNNALEAHSATSEDGTVSGGSILLSQTASDIIGDGNTLQAEADITTAGIQGDNNTLTAGGSIKTGDIGDAEQTGNIVGNNNALTAGTTLTVDGRVDGIGNVLSGTGDVTVAGDVTGEGNRVSSTGGNVSINGSIVGKDLDGVDGIGSNTVISYGNIKIDGTVAGEKSVVTAYGAGLSQDDVAISIGVFAAQGTDLRIATTSAPAYGVTNGNGSIVIGSMAAAQQWDENGNLVPVEEINKQLVNNIVSNNSFVIIGRMEGSNAYTQVTAAKDVIIGEPDTVGSEFDDTASNMTIKARNLRVNNNSLTLTDSVATVAESITGTSLTLTTTGTEEFVSTAASVNLASLTVANNAHLNVSGAVVLDNLTVNGTLASVSGSSIKVNNKLTMMNGAALSSFNINAPILEIINASVNAERLNGPQGLTATGATVTVNQGLDGLTQDVIAQAVYVGTNNQAILDEDNNPILTGEAIDGATLKKGYLTAASLSTTGNIFADCSTIQSRSSIAGDNITAQNGGLITAAGDITATGALTVGQATEAASVRSSVVASGTLAGASLVVEHSDVKATQGISLSNGGALQAHSGSKLQGNVTGAGNVTLDGGSFLDGTVSMSGALTVGSVDDSVRSSITGDVTGATGATLNHADLGGSLALAEKAEGVESFTADVEAKDSTIGGSVTNAHDVTLVGSAVKGTVTMDGALEVTDGSVGAVSGATSAKLQGATLHGGLALSEHAADGVDEEGNPVASVIAMNTLIEGGIANAVSVSLAGGSNVKGDVGMSGTLTIGHAGDTVRTAIAGSVTGATGATLNHADLSGSLALAEKAEGAESFTADVEAKDSTIGGSVTNAHDVTLVGSAVKGSVAMDGALEVTGGSVGAVSGATSANLQDTTLHGGLTLSGNAADGVDEEGNTIASVIGHGVSIEVGITNADSVSLEDSHVSGVVDMDGHLTLSNTRLDKGISGTVGAVDISNGSYVGSGITSNGTSVKVSGTSQVSGAITANGSNAEVTVKGGSTTGDITANQGSVTVIGSTTGDIDTVTANLTSSTVGDVTATHLTTHGVVQSGAVTVGTEAAKGSLTVNQGTLDAGKNAVTVHGSTTLNNGTVKAGSFTTDGLTQNGTVGELDSLTSYGTVSLVGGELKVHGNVDIDAVAGEPANPGNLELDGNATLVVDNHGSIDVEGLTRLTNESILKGITLDTHGLTVQSGSRVTMNGTEGDSNIKLHNGKLTVEGGTVEGNISGANGATVQDGGSVIGSIAMTGGDLIVTSADVDDVEGAVNATLTQAETGSLSMGGILTADHAQIAAIASSISSAKVTNGSVIGSNLTATGDIILSNSSVTGSVTGAAVTVIDSTIAAAPVDPVSNGQAPASGNVAGSTSVTVTGGSVAGMVVGGSVAADGSPTPSASATVTGATVGNGVYGTTVKVTEATVQNGGVHGTDTTVKDSAITGDVEGATSATITGGSVAGNVTGGTVKATEVAVTGNVAGSTSATVDGGSVAGMVVGGSVAADGSPTPSASATVTGAIVGNGVYGTTVKVTEATVQNGGVHGTDTTVKDSAITGDVEGATSATIKGGSVAGHVSGAAVTLTETSVTGNVTADTSLTTNGDVLVGARNDQGELDGSVTVGTETQKGSLTVNNGTLSAGTVTVHGQTTLNNGVVESGSFTTEGLTTNGVGGTIGGDLDAGNGTIELSGGSPLAVQGNVTGKSLELDDQTLDASGHKVEMKEDVSMTNGSQLIADNLTVNKGGKMAADSTGLSVDGSAVRVEETIAMNNTGLSVGNGASVQANTISGAHGVTLADGSVTGNLTNVQGDINLSQDSELNGNIGSQTDATKATDVTVSGSSIVNGDIYMDGALKVTDGSAVGDVTGAMNATLTHAETGDLAMGSVTTEGEGGTTTAYGTVSATGSALGAVSNAGNVSLDASTAGDIAFADGSLKAANATVGNVSNANSADITGTVNADSIGTGDLAVHEGSSLTAGGDIAADGKVAIEGAVTSTEGNISLTGKEAEGKNSFINADVTAQGKLTLAGEFDAAHAELAGSTVELQGTLNAGENVAIEGTLTGTGAINKTGKDTLALAGTTDLSKGSLNVSDQSTLDAADGAKLGKLTVTGGSTLEVEGNGIGSVSAKSVALAADTAIKSDVDLARGTVDTLMVDGKADLKGASVELRTGAPVNEAAVAEQTRLSIVKAGSIASSVNEDVSHALDTLNVHAENTGTSVDLVFSKNYKGVTGKTFNQNQAAAGLASLEALKPTGELGNVLDALHHTRSEADARAALDSLGGAGLAGLQKVMADDTKEHLQTLRSTMKSTAAGLQYRYNQYGQLEPGKDSNALAGSVTGGHSEVSGNGNSGKYQRDSIGFMLAYAHALPNKDWKFGADLAYSYADASCDATTIKSDAVYLDLALMHDRGRFHQMGTLGVAMFSFDTEREARVNAAGRSYSGKADGSTNAVEFNLSYEMNYDLVVKDQHKLSSVVLAEASFAQFDSMAESGMGNAGLNSEWDDTANLTFGLGGRYTYTFGEEKNPGYFMAEALFVAETGDTMPKVSNSFIGGGAAFDQEGPDAGDCGLRLNAGVLIPLGDQWGVFGNVTSEFRENQTGVGGSVGVKCSF